MKSRYPLPSVRFLPRITTIFIASCTARSIACTKRLQPEILTKVGSERLLQRHDAQVLPIDGLDVAG